MAASFSMAASEYLSTKSEEDKTQDPAKAAVYTGVAYILTVIFLILPYFVFGNVYLSLAIVFVNAILIVLFFNFYISVATDVSFKKRFVEMVTLSLGVSSTSFLFGLLARLFLKIEV